VTGYLSRRQFLAGAAVAAGGAVAATVAAEHPWTHTAATSARRSPTTPAKGTLVLVTLYGGNDGLNTVIPYADPHYAAARPTLGYPPEQVLPLADGLGLHPNLKGLKRLWDARHLAVVLGVGYPNPVLSHFRSMDIWQTASPTTSVSVGWLGRWLDSTGTDPMRALSIGPTLPTVLVGTDQTGTAISTGGMRIAGGAKVASSLSALWAPGTDRQGLSARVAGSGADLLSVQHTLADLLAVSPSAAQGSVTTAPPAGPTSTPSGAGSPTSAGSAGSGSATAGGSPSVPGGAAARGGTPTATTAPGSTAAGATAAPTAGALADGLQLVARLIKAGAPTHVYQVSLGGFDNHATEKATHARLMTELDDAVTGFFASLDGDPHGDAVTLLTYSEFGRRVSENGSEGTDHGTAAPLFVAGPSVKGGRFYGAPPSLTNLDDGNLRFTTDFRSVYASVLGPVLGVEPKLALGSDFANLGFL
jgi:uncharacterized protein (DUF1501 family)